MKRKHLFISSIIILLFIASSAFAYVQLALTAAEIAAPFILQSGVTYLMPATATSNVPSFGSVDSSSYKRNFLAKVGAATGIAVAGYLAYNDIKNLAQNSSSYPNLKTATQDTSKTPYTSASVGSIVLNEKTGQWLQITGVVTENASPGNYYVSPAGTTYEQWGTYGYRIYSNPANNNPDRYSTRTTYSAGVPATVPADQKTAKSDAQIQTAIAPNGSVSSAVQTEIDNMIKANPSSVTGLPSSDMQTATRDVARQEQVNSLQAAVDTAQAAYTANPTTENQLALDQAKADLAEAQADQADEQAEESDESDEFTGSVETTPELHSLDFSPLLGLSTTLSTKFPFSLLTTCKSLLTGFTASPTAPTLSFTFPAPFNYTWTFNLSAWDTWASLFRFLVGGAFLFVVGNTIMRRWV